MHLPPSEPKPRYRPIPIARRSLRKSKCHSSIRPKRETSRDELMTTCQQSIAAPEGFFGFSTRGSLARKPGCEIRAGIRSPAQAGLAALPKASKAVTSRPIPPTIRLRKRSPLCMPWATASVLTKPPNTPDAIWEDSNSPTPRCW
jgi:hypothetical protein